jgi:tryptophan synthase beta chain
VAKKNPSHGRALDGFAWLARTEGILPALESSHAVAWLKAALRGLAPESTVLVNLSGRGDKDVDTVRQLMDREAVAGANEGRA